MDKDTAIRVLNLYGLKLEPIDSLYGSYRGLDGIIHVQNVDQYSIYFPASGTTLSLEGLSVDDLSEYIEKHLLTEN